MSGKTIQLPAIGCQHATPMRHYERLSLLNSIAIGTPGDLISSQLVHPVREFEKSKASSGWTF
jgi:hypothetical protein